MCNRVELELLLLLLLKKFCIWQKWNALQVVHSIELSITKNKSLYKKSFSLGWIIRRGRWGGGVYPLKHKKKQNCAVQVFLTHNIIWWIFFACIFILFPDLSFPYLPIYVRFPVITALWKQWKFEFTLIYKREKNIKIR